MGGVEEHVRLERLDHAVGLIVHEQDRQRHPFGPECAVGDAGLVPAVGQEMLTGDRNLLTDVIRAFFEEQI